MTACDPRLTHFVASRLFTIPGHLNSEDALIWCRLLGEGRGSLVEVGVDKGRAFALLALARGDGERALAVDTFTDGREAMFRRAMADNHIVLSQDEMFIGNSKDLPPAVLVSRVGSVRFFHIDGGHTYADVTNDLHLAGAALTQEGIIALDDYSCFLWPEVGMAINDWLRTNPGFKPFAITESKLYVARAEHASHYGEMLLTAGVPCIREVGLHGSSVRVFGRSRMARRIEWFKRVLKGNFRC